MNRKLLFAASFIPLMLLLTYCTSTGSWWQQETMNLRTELGMLRQEYTDAGNEEAAAKVAVLEGHAEKLETRLKDATTAEDAGWGALEVAMGVAAGAFPALAIAVPMIRTLRRATTRIFESVASGGGVKNGEEARRVLSADPKAYAMFKKWKQQRGMPG